MRPRHPVWLWFAGLCLVWTLPTLVWGQSPRMVAKVGRWEEPASLGHYGVLGEIASPGIYTSESPVTVQQLIARAGGLPESASPALKLVRQKRGGQSLFFSPTGQDRLVPGDLIIVDAAHDSRGKQIAASPAPSGVWLAMIGVAPHPVVVRLSPDLAQLPILMQMLGQSQELAKSVKLLTAPRQFAPTVPGALVSGMVLLFDPNLLVTSNLPTFPAPQPLFAPGTTPAMTATSSGVPGGSSVPTPLVFPGPATAALTPGSVPSTPGGLAIPANGPSALPALGVNGPQAGGLPARPVASGQPVGSEPVSLPGARIDAAPVPYTTPGALAPPTSTASLPIPGSRLAPRSTVPVGPNGSLNLPAPPPTAGTGGSPVAPTLPDRHGTGGVGESSGTPGLVLPPGTEIIPSLPNLETAPPPPTEPRVEPSPLARSEMNHPGTAGRVRDSSTGSDPAGPRTGTGSNSVATADADVDALISGESGAPSQRFSFWQMLGIGITVASLVGLAVVTRSVLDRDSRGTLPDRLKRRTMLPTNPREQYESEEQSRRTPSPMPVANSRSSNRLNATETDRASESDAAADLLSIRARAGRDEPVLSTASPTPEDSAPKMGPSGRSRQAMAGSASAGALPAEPQDLDQVLRSSVTVSHESVVLPQGLRLASAMTAETPTYRVDMAHDELAAPYFASSPHSEPILTVDAPSMDAIPRPHFAMAAQRSVEQQSATDASGVLVTAGVSPAFVAASPTAAPLMATQESVSPTITSPAAGESSARGTAGKPPMPPRERPLGKPAATASAIERALYQLRGGRPS